MTQSTPIETPESTLDQALFMGSLGYKIVPLPPGQKYPKGLGAWQAKATADAEQITDWWGTGESGIGWAMGRQPNGMNLVAVDIDIANGKQGAETYKALVEEYGLASATANTIVSKTGSGGRHIIFETAETLTNTILGPGLDLRGEGGFIVIPPSIHPNGERYAWVPGKAPWDVAPVKAKADFEGFMREPQPSGSVRGDQPTTEVSHGQQAPSTDDDTPGDWARANISISALLAEQGWAYIESKGDDQYWCRPGKNPRDGHSAILHGDSPLVVWSTSAPGEFWRAGTTTRDGGKALSPLEVFAAIHHHGDVRAASSAIRRLHMPRNDSTDILKRLPVELGADPVTHAASAAANMPDEFWQSRPMLEHIRSAAHSRMVSPDATLLGVLSRFAALVPPTYRIPAIVGSQATLDFIGCSVASSSGGKTVANHVAADLVPIHRKDIFADLPVGSGEGLIQSFMVDEVDDDGKKTGKQVVGMTAIHFTIDEGTALMEQQARRGTTIVQTLCSAWSGATLGQANASAETRRIIEARRVRVSSVINIQTANGHLLLDERMIAVGLPQRIVFASAHSPLPAIGDLPDWPGSLDLPVPPTIGQVVKEITFDAVIVSELREARYAVATGKVVLGPVDGHLGLSRTKIAALLALMDGRASVNLADWELSSHIMLSSLVVRDKLLAVKRETDRERITTQGEAQAHRELATESVKERQAIDRLGAAILRKLEAGEMSCKPLARATTSSATRHRFDDALDLLRNRGAISVEAVEGQGEAGRIVKSL